MFCFPSISPRDKQPWSIVLLPERQLRTEHILLIFRSTQEQAALQFLSATINKARYAPLDRKLYRYDGTNPVRTSSRGAQPRILGKLGAGAIVLEPRCLYIRCTTASHITSYTRIIRSSGGGSLVTGRRNREPRNYACGENPMFSSFRSLRAEGASSIVFPPPCYFRLTKYTPATKCTLVATIGGRMRADT